jgi:hypothetical protein
METIQFNHNYELGRTYAVDVNFEKEDLMECVHNFDGLIGIKVGIAYLNPKDKHYNKKIGREVSSKKLEMNKFQLKKVENHGEKSFLFLDAPDLLLIFRVFKHSNKPHLIQVYDKIKEVECCGNSCQSCS